MSNHQTCTSNVHQSHSNHLCQESTSLNSQPSYPSIPSLTSQAYRLHHHPTTHHLCIATVKGDTSYTASIALAGKFFYTGSSDKEIRLWNRDTLTSELDDENLIEYKVTAGYGAVKSLVVLADKLISAHQDHKIRVWKIDSHEEDNNKFSLLATLPTLSDRALKLLNPKNQVKIRRHKKCTWVHHVDAVSALALSSDESLLYSVSWDRTLKIWRTTDFKCLESVGNAHDDAINALALTNDGDVYTGSADKTIKVWRKNSGETKHSLVSTLDKHKSGVNALALSVDGSVLYSGACDRSILVWEKDNVGNMAALGALRGHTKSVLCLTVVSDFVCSGSADKTVRIWRGVDRCYYCLAVLEGHNGPVKCLTAGSDGYNPSDATSMYFIYSGSLDCDIKVWQIFVPLF
ncbi:protein JINGUBANG-like [Actinidia eriantha]|uniref:protein JINGUBANG-like n=1 Tax=Actinidia eriantha TaxID=165200 RepID=UPI002588F58D|nr:protein JINGUBANG-like [Actinidia eriantha]